MGFNWTGTASTNRDTEGLTYMGGGKLVVAEERPFDAYSFQYLAGGSAPLGVTTLSDIQTLSPVDSLTGQPAADNLLVLNLGSNRLLETDRLGNVKSSFNLATLGLGLLSFTARRRKHQAPVAA